MYNIKTIILIVLGMLFLSACSTTDKINDKVTDHNVIEESNQTLPDEHKTCCIGSRIQDPLEDTHSILAKRSIYFDYNSYTVKDEFKPLVEAHSRYLLSNKTRHIVIEGNTDERGSREYNIALGMLRADKVHMLFKLYGVPEVQVEVVSFGEERPKAEGRDEISWAENRRVDIDY